MFQAGVVAVSSLRLLQLLTPALGEVDKPPFTGVDIDGSGLRAGLVFFGAPGFGIAARPVSVPLKPLAREKYPPPPIFPPVLCGLMTPLLFPPMALLKMLRWIAWALLLNAPMHCNT